MTKGRAFAAAAAALLFLFISQTASAQYPPPQGSLICQLAQSQVIANSTLVMTVRLIDNNGNSVPGPQFDCKLHWFKRLAAQAWASPNKPRTLPKKEPHASVEGTAR